MAIPMVLAAPVTAEPTVKKTSEPMSVARRPKMAARPPIQGISAVDDSE